MSETTTEYRPGACNIGVEQRRHRYRLAGVAAFAAVAYLVAIAFVDAPRALALGVFVPLSLGVEWFLQGHRSFCAALGFAGRYRFDDAGGVIRDESARTADRRYAFRLTLLGLVAGGVLSASAYALFAFA